MKKLNLQELQQAVKTLALLARQGFPLSQGVKNLSQDSPAWLEVKSRMDEGDTLGQALTRYPNVFSSHFSGMVDSATRSERGETILASLSRWLEAAESVRSNVRDLLHYPFLLLSFLLMSSAVLVGFGLPHLILPLAFDVRMDQAMKYQDLCTGGAFILFLLAGACLMGSHRIQWVLPLTLRIPSFRATVHRADQALWARAVAGHLMAGLELAEAMKSSSGVVWSSELEAQLASLPERLGKGDLLSQALAECSLVDPQLRWSVTAGEAREDLAATLLFAAEQLEKNLEVQCRAFFLFLQPVAIAVIGLLTAAVLGSFWWAMYHHTWNLVL